MWCPAQPEGANVVGCTSADTEWSQRLWRRKRRDCTAQASSSGRRTLEEPAQRGGQDTQSMRPWQFDLPSLADMEQEDWMGKVRDWELFWARHKVWQNYVQHRARRGAKPRTAHEEWWGLHDLESVEKVRTIAVFCALPWSEAMHVLGSWLMVMRLRDVALHACDVWTMPAWRSCMHAATVEE